MENNKKTVAAKANGHPTAGYCKGTTVEGNYVQLRDEDCERAVLGTLMTERNAMNDVRELLSEECFYNDFYREIYRAIEQITSTGDRADMIMVKSRLASAGVSFDIMDFMAVAGATTFDLHQYAARLHDLCIRRRFHGIGQYLLANSYTERDDIEDVTTSVTEMLSSLFRSSDSAVFRFRESIEEVYGLINHNLSESGTLTGTPTGFGELDRKSGGLQKSDLIVIAGETSMGKTSLAVSMMRNAVLAGAKVAMYSMEMRKEQVASRILSMQTGIPSNKIMYAKLSQSQIKCIDREVSKIIDSEIYFDDRSTSNIDTILASIRYMKLKHNIDGAVVDYLQILNVNMKGANKEQQMGDVSRRLKNIAKELDIWVIALSQLNRDAINPVPTLARLRDSGQIAEAADIVVLIYRPEAKGKGYPEEYSGVSTRGTALIDVAKGRNIGQLRFICGFNHVTTQFYDLEKLPAAEPEDAGEQEEEPF